MAHRPPPELGRSVVYHTPSAQHESREIAALITGVPIPKPGWPDTGAAHLTLFEHGCPPRTVDNVPVLGTETTISGAWRYPGGRGRR